MTRKRRETVYEHYVRNVRKIERPVQIYMDIFARNPARCIAWPLFGICPFQIPRSTPFTGFVLISYLRPRCRRPITSCGIPQTSIPLFGVDRRASITHTVLVLTRTRWPTTVVPVKATAIHDNRRCHRVLCTYCSGLSLHRDFETCTRPR